MDGAIPPGDDALQPLREALKVSPDNVPLRRHLADLLLGLGRFAEAAEEYRQALSREPGSAVLKLGLATAFFRQGKLSAAAVVVEELLKSPEPPARARVIQARLCLRSGDVDHDFLAKKTDGFSGADLKAVVDLAVEAKLREAMARGAPLPLENRDLQAAARSLRPTTKEWFSTARNYAVLLKE